MDGEEAPNHDDDSVIHETRDLKPHKEDHTPATRIDGLIIRRHEEGVKYHYENGKRVDE